MLAAKFSTKGKAAGGICQKHSPGRFFIVHNWAVRCAKVLEKEQSLTFAPTSSNQRIVKIRSDKAMLVFFSLCFTACSMTKGLEEGKVLHGSTVIQFADPEKVNRQGRVEAALTAMARPKPATGLEKWQVGIYNTVNKKGKEKGAGAWLQRKFGRPPVLYDATLTGQSRLLMEKYLSDHGYFGASVEVDTTMKGKKAAVHYTVETKGQYMVREIYRPTDSLALISVLAGRENETLLKRNRPYNLSLLSAERARLAGVANENGFFEVTRDHFYYFVDTTAGELMADIHLRLKQPEDSSLYQVYFLGQAWVFPDYSLAADTAARRPDTLHAGNLVIVQSEELLRPAVLIRLVWQDESAVFSKKDQSQTLSRLMGLGIYKFVNMRFEPSVRQDTHYLDRLVYLTPGPLRDLAMEFQVNSRSGNFLGTEVSASFAHKNLFRGAELFSTDITTGVETNVGANAGTLLNTVHVGLHASLGLPGIRAPFLSKGRVKGATLPRTAFTLGDDFQHRAGFFSVNAFNLSAGYTWEGSGWQHQFNPLFVNLVNTLQTSDKLKSLLAENRRLRASFENVLIAGMGYKVSYSNVASTVRGRHFFWRGGIEPAGNLLGLFASGGSGEEPATVAGIRFSQFLKIDSDLRQYFPLRKGMLAGRFNLGIAYPYGNAEVLPYIKQYFIGGAGSVRAFRIRTLGPGSYQTKLEENGSNFVDQTGDLRLELNLEYRFPIISYLKGALFADAGNIWLLRGDADELTPEVEGRFRFGSFLRETAIGTGFGLRVDFEVAVLRLDWAFPLRKPSLPEDARWLLSDLEPWSRKWRRDNVVWNIAIGYPF